MNSNRGNGAKFPHPLASPPWPLLRFVEDPLWSPLGTAKNRWGDSLWLVGFGRSGVWSLWGTGSLTPKLGCRVGRWSKNDPQIRVSDRSVKQEWSQIWLPSCREGENDPPDSMPGVVGRVKRPPNSILGGLDYFTLFAMTGRGWIGLLYFVRNDEERGLDCHASLAMMGLVHEFTKVFSRARG